MIAYVGQGRITSGCKKARELREVGLGWCLCPGELPPLHGPWFLDNGAFRAWSHGQPFDRIAFEEAVDEARALTLEPDFVVAPDVVGGGRDSLDLSLSWLDALSGLRVYVAVQDGMQPSDVAPHLERVAGLFVGGTLDWKLMTAAAWRELAHAHGRRCHVGRVGTPDRVRWALHEVKADSIDSSLPLWSREKLAGFLAALSSSQVSAGALAITHASRQRRLFA